MKKTLLSLAVFSACIFSALSSNSKSLAAQPETGKSFEIPSEKKLTIGSSRVSGKMQLNFIAGIAGQALITIQNESGEIVLRQNSRIKKSLNIIAVENVLALPEGLYSVKLISDKETYTAQFIIWE